MHSDRKTIRGHEYTVYGANLDLIRWVGSSTLAQDALRDAKVTEEDLYLAFGADSDQERVRHAKAVIRKLWDAHPFLGPYPFLDLLSYCEFSKVFHPGHRDHVCHQLKVYLLGLFAYDRCPSLRAGLDRELGLGGRAQFPLRWLVTAVYHDIGYVLENEPAQVLTSDLWQDTRTALTASLATPLAHTTALRDLVGEHVERAIVEEHRLGEVRIANDPRALTRHLRDGKWLDLFALLSPEAVRAGLQPRWDDPPLQTYWDYAASHKPSPERPAFYDHGIASALLLLRGWHGWGDRVRELVQVGERDERLRPHRGRLEQLKGELDAHEESVRAAAAAMALHNVDRSLWDGESVYENGLDLSHFRICLDREGRETPLAFLLGLVDTLQGWDRPNYREPRPDDRPALTDQDISITADGKKLLLYFPADLAHAAPEAVPESLFRRTTRALEAYLQEDAIERIVGATRAPEPTAATPIATAPVAATPAPPPAPIPTPAPPSAPPREPPSGPRSTWWLAAVLVALSSIALVLIYRPRTPTPPEPVAPTAPPRRARCVPEDDRPQTLDQMAEDIHLGHAGFEATDEAPDAEAPRADGSTTGGGTQRNIPAILDAMSGQNACFASVWARFGRAVFQPARNPDGWTIERVDITHYFEGRDQGYWRMERDEETLHHPRHQDPGIEFIPRTTDLWLAGDDQRVAFYYRIGAPPYVLPVMWLSGGRPLLEKSRVLDARRFLVAPDHIRSNNGTLVILDEEAEPAQHCFRSLTYFGTEMRFRARGGHKVDLLFGADGAGDRRPEVASEIFPAARGFAPDPDTYQAAACERLEGEAWAGQKRDALGAKAGEARSRAGWRCRVPLAAAPGATDNDGSPLYVVYAASPYDGCRPIAATRRAIYDVFGMKVP